MSELISYSKMKEEVKNLDYVKQIKKKKEKEKEK